jgi:2-oxo-4-hydroxy-4-carboxy-5-ureidoimidazoline decarboxylase
MVDAHGTEADQALLRVLRVSRLNALPLAEARAALERCCGSARWVDGMLAARPFADLDALQRASLAHFADLGPEDYREAFRHHPEIGANIEELRRKFASTADLSLREQAGASAASEATLQALAAGNARYRARFGYSFIVCATGKSAEQMLALLQARLGNTSEDEIAIAAAEQVEITELRLQKLEP